VTAVLVATVLFARFLVPGNNMMMPQNNSADFFSPPPHARFLATHAGHDRVLIIRGRKTFFPLMAKSGTLWGFNVVEDYEPLAPRAYFEARRAFGLHEQTKASFWQSLTQRERDERWRFLDLMSTRYVVVERAAGSWPAEPPGRFRLAYEDDRVQIFENVRSLPRAYLVERSEVLDGRTELLAQMLMPLNLDPKTTVLLPSPVRWSSTDEERHLASRADLEKVTAHEVSVRVATPRPAVLVLTDLYWPGWRATVDGEPREIHRANLLFRAVAVEAGEHEVRFRYEPLSARLGAGITFAAVVVLALSLALLPRARQER
jgi:hypothetical protein